MQMSQEKALPLYLPLPLSQSLSLSLSVCMHVFAALIPRQVLQWACSAGSPCLIV